MAKRSVGTVIVSGALICVATIVSGVVGFFGLLLALNGFMGQEHAVNSSIAIYVVLAIIVIALCVVFGGLTANFLQKRFEWRGVSSVLASAFGFAAIGVVMHIVSVVIAAIVADQLRTHR
jgi:hypothetical protein